MKQKVFDCLLLILSLILALAALPNYFYLKGFWFLAYFELIPLVILFKRASEKEILLLGFIFGFLYSLGHVYWLYSYHFATLFLVLIFEGGIYLFVFFLMKKGNKWFKENEWLYQWLVWCSFEYLRSVGFFGFNYGIIGYSQWSCPVVLQFAEIAGVWGINLIVSFPSFFIGKLVNSFFSKKAVVNKINVISASSWCIVFVFVILFGSIKLNKSNPPEKTLKTAVIQTNENHRLTSVPNQRLRFNSYKKIINDIIEEDPNIELIVLPESAILSRVTFREDEAYTEEEYLLARDYVDFFNTLDVPVLYGGAELEFRERKEGKLFFNQYNVAYLINTSEKKDPPVPQIYRKNHLVPLFENYPFKKLFPFFYEKVVKKIGTDFKPGKQINLLEVKDIKAGTPICFEDMFDNIPRKMTEKGADIFISIANDSWSKSKLCQYEHLAISTFRAVENRRPLIRSSVSGQSVYLDEKGQIKKMLEPFMKDYFIETLEVPAKTKTAYQVIKNSLGIIAVIITALLILSGLMNTESNKKQEHKGRKQR